MSSADHNRRQGSTPRGPDRTAPRLVVGDDGSPAADVVWLWVNNHRWSGWRISVVSARRPKIGPPVAAERATLHPWEPPLPRQLLTGDDVEVEHMFAETDPRLALDSCADAALVAVGPRGRGLLKHLHIGSTAEWLIGARRPLAPVVVVRSARVTKDVLLCTDGSDHAREALEVLLALPWLTTCRIAVLGVDDGRNTTEEAVTRAVAALREHGVDQVEHEVVHARAHTAENDTRSVILGTIGQRSPDLVALGARGTGASAACSSARSRLPSHTTRRALSWSPGPGEIAGPEAVCAPRATCHAWIRRRREHLIPRIARVPRPSGRRAPAADRRDPGP